MGGGAFGDLQRSMRDDAMVVVAIPALCLVLLDLENQKGAPLTKDEVLAAVDAAPAITMLREDAAQLAEMRGDDLDAGDVWTSWLAFRATLDEEEN